MTQMNNIAHGFGQTKGWYFKGFSDFALEIQQPTGVQPLPVGSDIYPSPSLSLCRALKQYDHQLVYPAGTSLTQYIESDSISGLLNSTSGGKFLYRIDTIVVGTTTTYLKHYVYDHYLCPSSPEWSATSYQRSRTVAESQSDMIFFDVVHMPANGCFCNWCRLCYALAFSPNQDTNSTQWKNYYKNFVSQSSTPLDYGGLSLTQQQRLRNFMNLTQQRFFASIGDTLHRYGPNQPYGTIGIVSVEDLGGLIKDDYRTDFAAIVDIPKTEWYTPIKQGNNRVFFGEKQSNVLDTVYYSVLSDYRIPEDIRVAGALMTLRDASKYQMAYIWIPYHFLKNELDNPNTPIVNEYANHSLINNKRLRTSSGRSKSGC